MKMYCFPSPANGKPAAPNSNRSVLPLTNLRFSYDTLSWARSVDRENPCCSRTFVYIHFNVHSVSRAFMQVVSELASRNELATLSPACATGATPSSATAHRHLK